MKLIKDTWTTKLSFIKTPPIYLKQILKKYKLSINTESLKKLDIGIFNTAFDMICDYFYNNDCKILNININNLYKEFLNGAENWKQYSWGGSALCYNNDIMKHYLTESEINNIWKKYDKDNDFSFDFLLDLQADCLQLAFLLIRKSAIKANIKKGDIKNA